jgi:hypothetical protein
MTAAGLPPNVRVIETAHGVCYRYTWHKWAPPPAVGLIGAMAALPLVAGVLAISFLVRHVTELPAALTALGLLFPAQMAFLARWPAWFLAHGVWQSLVTAVGHSDLAVDGRWLVVASCLGPLRRRWRRPAPEVRQLTVYVYPTGSTATAGGVPPQPAQDELACLAAEFPGTAPWLLVDGLSRGEAVALAEDLNPRLAAATAEAGVVRQLPPVAIVETTQDALDPRSGGPGLSFRRKLWWLAWHLAGCVGLAALWVAARQTTDWENSRTRLCVFAAGFLEAILIVATLKWPGQPGETPGKK